MNVCHDFLHKIYNHTNRPLNNFINSIIDFKTHAFVLTIF